MVSNYSFRSTLLMSQFSNENEGQFVVSGGTISAGEITLNGGVMMYRSGTVNAPYVASNVIYNAPLM